MKVKNEISFVVLQIEDIGSNNELNNLGLFIRDIVNNGISDSFE